MYKVAHKTISVSTATATEVVLPEGSKNHVIRPATATAWAWSVTATEAASAGAPVASGAQLEIAGPVGKQSVFVYQASGGAVTYHWTYEYRA